MKRVYIILLSAFMFCILGGCFKDYNERYFYRDNMVEFQDAVVNANTSSYGFPVLPAVLGDEVGTVRLQVNMTGEQKGYDRTVNFRVIADNTTAREGIEFNLPQGNSFIIPANSSFGWIEVEILPEGTGNRVIAFELLETGDIGVMNLYNRIGFRVLYYSTPPDPGTVEQINDIKYFSNITLGAQENVAIGNHIDILTGDAYVKEGASANQDKIDLVYLRGSSTGFNFLTPSASGFSAWASSVGGHILNEWTIRNHGTLVRLEEATSEELARFEDAESVADLVAAFVHARTTVQDRSGYNATNHGPQSRIRHMGAGDLVLYYSADRNAVAMIKVINAVGPDVTNGHIELEIKSGQIAEDPSRMNQIPETTLGGQTSTEVGGMIDLLTGGVYFRDGCASCLPKAGPVKEQIDLVYVHGSAAHHTLFTAGGIGSVYANYRYINDPNDPLYWGGDSNNGVLIRLVNPSSEELSLFDNAESVADLMAAFEYAVTAAPDRNYAGYDPVTYDVAYYGPGHRAQRLEAGELLAYYSLDRDFVALIRLNDVYQTTTANNTANKRVDMEIKSGQFGPF